MAINRRTVLKALAAGSVCQWTPAAFAQQPTELIIGACRLAENQYALSAVDLNGRLQWQLPIPARGHDVAVHDTQKIGVAIARRPGQFLVLFDTQSGKQWQSFQVDDQLKLNGHAVWVGNELIVSGADRLTSQMILLRYTLKDNRLHLVDQHRFDHFGPHQMVRFENAIYVAVGGLKTDEREVTNADDFQSSVLQLHATTLQTITHYPAITNYVSLRHLTVDQTGQVFIAGQTQQQPQDSECLLFAIRDGALQPFAAPETLWAQLNGYLGSIQMINGNVVTTSPRSNWLGQFDPQTLALSDQFFTHDICALAQSSQGLVAGTGTGKMIIGEQAINSHIIWDNHFTVTNT